jgi:hypothetical protein
MPNYYELLGLERDADVSQIRSAYISEAIRWHPDNNAGSDQAAEAHRQVSTAYLVLSNPSARHAYDRSLRLGKSSEAPDQGSDFVSTEETRFKEMMDLAADLAVKNETRKRIAEALEREGCTATAAGDIAKQVEAAKKSEVRKSVRKAFLWAAGAMMLAIAISLASYLLAAPGGTYLIPTGLLLVCAFYFFRGLFFLISGEVPKQRARMASPETEKKEWEARLSDTAENYCHICNKTYDNAATCPVHGVKLTRIV